MFVFDYFDKVLISYFRHNNDRKCCANCIRRRFLNSRKDRQYLIHDNNFQFSTDFVSEQLSWIIESIWAILELDECLIDFNNRRKVLILDKMTLQLETVYCNSFPDCESCGTLPVDSLSNAHNLGEVFKKLLSTPRQYRSKSSVEFGQQLENLVLEKNVGIITCLLDYYEGTFPNAVAMLPLENGKDEPGTGRTSSLVKSRAVAMLEAMERYAGFRPRGKKTIIYESYNSLKEKGLPVINPYELILNENSLSNIGTTANSKFKFENNKYYHWVYGYDVLNEEPILLPETYIYYGLTLKSKEYNSEIFVYEVSNGCATGSNILESSYFGLLEVIERDNFLTAWYTDRDITEIIYTDIVYNSELEESLKNFFFKYSDFDLHFFDISTELSAITILCTIERKIPDKKKMNFMCAAASDFNIEEAMNRALHEITSIFYGLEKRFEEEYEEISYKSNDMTLIHTMDDHSLVYGCYDKLNEIRFREQATSQRKISDYIHDYNSINNCYEVLLQELRALNKKILIFDQTTEEMRQVGLFCTKTVVPGLLPMTFGYNNLRVSKERIEELEKCTGRKLELTFLAHPFP